MAGLLSGRCRVWTEVGSGKEVRRLVQLCGEKALVGEKRKEQGRVRDLERFLAYKNGQKSHHPPCSLLCQDSASLTCSQYSKAPAPI